jgi:aspartyl-tRNA(Asn)/glutamyl-tRNA(Gln) amidotransferase subunit B
MSVSEEVKKQYTPTIGIEAHVQLKTKTKLFAAVGNDARDAAPNTLISHICVGMPGALPVLNEHAVELTAKAAFALGVEPQKFSKFDRKHYFYPDLPKGYQITQYDQPLIVGGQVDIQVEDQKKIINITRAHLEEDAGKNTHPEGADYSLVDLNRAGTPLLEIVSEPEIHSAAEAKAYARELWLIMKYADVTEGDLYQGHVRFDVNVSVSKDESKPGTRTETKNLNSFRSVEGAVEYEINRQIELLESGEQITQETRGWNEAKQKTTSQRGKEEAHDYRYMPEPDIPPIELNGEYISGLKAEQPRKPSDWREVLNKLSIETATIETLLEADVEKDDISYLKFIEERLDDQEKAKFLVNWYVNMLIPVVREQEFEFNYEFLNLATIIYDLVKTNKLNSTNARLLYRELIQENVSSWPDAVEKYAEQKGYLQVSDEGEIEKVVVEVLSENPKAAEDVKNGETKAIGFLVGQVMKKSQGKANPSLAQKFIKKHLEI